MSAPPHAMRQTEGIDAGPFRFQFDYATVDETVGFPTSEGT